MTHPLADKTRDELIVIARSLGIKPHHKANPETIITQIMAQPSAFVQDASVKAASTNSAAAAVPVVQHKNSEDDVRDAIKNHLDKAGFTAEFPPDGTWIFRCAGAEDSGTLQMPLSIIKRSAEFVARGRRGMPNMGTDGKISGYAGTILAV